jgi:hypothetical protein
MLKKISICTIIPIWSIYLLVITVHSTHCLPLHYTYVWFAEKQLSFHYIALTDWLLYPRCVYSAVRSKSLNRIHVNLSLCPLKLLPREKGETREPSERQLKLSPTGLHRPRGLQETEAPSAWKWQGSQPYAPAAFTPEGDIPGTHFC